MIDRNGEMERRSPHDGDEEYPATSVDGDKNRSIKVYDPVI